MAGIKHPKEDLQIYPTSVLEFEITLHYVEDGEAAILKLKDQCKLLLADRYRVLALTDCYESGLKHLVRLNVSDTDFDEALVRFVNNDGRCAIVIDSLSSVQSPDALAALLGRINSLCKDGGGIDWIAVLVRKDWMDVLLATDPVASAHAESLVDDLKYREEQKANQQLVNPSSSTDFIGLNNKPIIGADLPVSARVHLAGVALSALINGNPQSINEAMFDKAVDIADQMLLALASSRSDHGDLL